MRRLLRKTFLVVLVAAMSLEAAYVLAGLVFLNTRLASEAINRRPQKFQIRWRFAWTLWPGIVTLHDVETRGRSGRTGWYAHLDSVRARCRLLPLFDRTVDLARVRAAGVDYRLRRDRPPGATPVTPDTELPSIPGLFDGAKAEGEARGPTRPPGRPWTIRADRIDCDVEQLWIDRYRLTGRMRVETPMDLVVRGPMAFSHVRIAMPSGDLRTGDETVFAALSLDARATLHPFIPKEARGLAFFRYLSGRFVLASDDASLAFLEPYFKKAPWLHFNSRTSGRIEMLLDHGRLLPASRLEASNDAVDIEVLDRHLTGQGVITGTVVETDGVPRSRVTVLLKRFQVAPLGSDVPFARGEGASLVGTSDSPDLSHPFTTLHVVLDLPKAQILDLSFYNSMIPPGSEFRLVSGTGTLSYHLEGSHEERSLHGTIDLAVKEGAATFKNLKLGGSFRLQTRLRQASPRDLLFDISGTRLDVRTRSPAWSAAFTLPRSEMRFTGPMTIDATVRFSMQDTRPLVALFDAFKDVPDWLERFMIIQDIDGHGTIGVRQQKVEVKDLEVNGHGMHALADLSVGEAATEGILYVRFHGFSLGIDLRPGGKDLKLLRPLHWFETQRSLRASRRRPPAP